MRGDLGYYRFSVLLILMLLTEVIVNPSAVAALDTVIPIDVTVQDGRTARRRMIDARVEEPGRVIAYAGESLVSLLDGMIDPRTASDLAGTAWLTSEALESAGLIVTYEIASLSARIHVPPGVQPIQSLSVRGARLISDAPIVPPARFSVALPFYLSVQSTETDVETLSGFDPDTRYGINLLPAIGFGATLLSADLNYGVVDQEVELENWEAALSRDFRGTTRLTLGTTRIDTFGFQSSRPVLGFGVERREGIGGTTVLDDRYRSSFEVNTDSVADIYVNDRLIRSNRLAPGSYELSDFPLLPGLNEISIVITDIFGDTRVIDGRVSHATGLLPAGVGEFGVAAGMIGEQYDIPLVRGYLRRGLAEWLSADLYGEATEYAYLGGINLLTVSAFGTFEAGGAAGLENGEVVQDVEYAVRGRYQFNVPGSEWVPSVGLSALYRSPGFFSPGVYTGTGPEAVAPWVFNATVNQPLPLGSTLLLGSRYTIATGDNPDTAGFYAYFSTQLGNRASLRAGANLDFQDSDYVAAGRITVVVRTGSGGGSYRTTYHVNDQELDVGAIQGFRGDNIRGSAGIAADRIDLENGTVQTLSGTARVSNARVELATAARLSPADAVFADTPERIDLRARFGSGLYYADGLFGIGTPSTGSFALVGKDRGLPSGPVLVNPTSNGAEARTSFLGAAVLNALPDYYQKRVNTELPDLPIDFALVATALIIETGHRTGTAIRIGGSRLLYGMGTLVDNSGGPVGLKVFRVVRDDEETVLTGFTDERGGFTLYDLAPGEYTIRLTDSAVGARFSLASDDEPPFDLGRLVYVAEKELEK